MTLSHPRQIKLTIDNQLENTPLVAMAVRGLCSLENLSSQEINRMELCVVEAINNAIQHAYAADEKNHHTIEIIVEFTATKKITFHIVDYGKTIDHFQEKLSQTIQSKTNHTMELGGRGLMIIHKIMDEISYHSHQGRNCLTMSCHF